MPKTLAAAVDLLLAQLIEAWRTNHRINLYLLDRISDEGMTCTLSTRGGRNVTRQFAHLHNVRVWHLEARAPDLAQKLPRFATQDEPPKHVLRACLEESADRIAEFIAQSTAGRPRRRASRKGVASTVGYFIAHESHHRGNILLTLKQCGHPLDQASRHALWDWDKR